MKKYIIIFTALAFVACKGSNKMTEEQVRQRTIDSMAAVNEANRAASEHHHSESSHTSSSSSTNESSGSNNTENTEPAKRKGMSNTTKGALIGTGAGIVGGAATGAAVSKDKGKGALIGGAVGGAVGSGVGYGIGAKKDKDQKDAGQ